MDDWIHHCSARYCSTYHTSSYIELVTSMALKARRTRNLLTPIIAKGGVYPLQNQCASKSATHGFASKSDKHHKPPARQRGSFTYYFFVFHSSLTRGRFGEVLSNSEEVEPPASRKMRASFVLRINTVDFKPKVWYNYKKVML